MRLYTHGETEHQIQQILQKISTNNVNDMKPNDNR